MPSNKLLPRNVITKRTSLLQIGGNFRRVDLTFDLSIIEILIQHHYSRGTFWMYLNTFLTSLIQHLTSRKHFTSFAVLASNSGLHAIFISKSFFKFANEYFSNGAKTAVGRLNNLINSCLSQSKLYNLVRLPNCNVLKQDHNFPHLFCMMFSRSRVINFA